MRVLLLVGSLAVARMALSSSAAFADPEQYTVAPTTSSADDSNMIICHENQAVTGSRLGENRECHTKAQWDKRRADIQRTIVNAQQIGLSGNPNERNPSGNPHVH